MREDIYGGHREAMEAIMRDLAHYIEDGSIAREAEYGDRLYEHLSCRIKSDESMREKLVKRGLEPTAHNALRAVRDAIGLRVVCLFIDDVYANVQRIKAYPGCTVVQEKDYIKKSPLAQC